ncbi:MAG: hypothetical protein AAB426_00540 [Myxococcota bacterium]
MSREKSTHRLADEALQLLGSGKGERYALESSGAQKLTRSLSALFGTAELRDAVDALVRLAYFLAEKQGSPGAAKSLLDVAATAIEPLKALGAAGQQVADAMRASAARVSEKVATARPSSSPMPTPGRAGGAGISLGRKKR